MKDPDRRYEGFCDFDNFFGKVNPSELCLCVLFSFELCLYILFSFEMIGYVYLFAVGRGW